MVSRWIHTKRRIHKSLVTQIRDLISEESTQPNPLIIKNREKRVKFLLKSHRRLHTILVQESRKIFHSTFPNSWKPCVILHLKNPQNLQESLFFPDWRRNGESTSCRFPIPRHFLPHLPPFLDAASKLELKFMNLATEAGKGNEVFLDKNQTYNEMNYRTALNKGFTFK